MWSIGDTEIPMGSSCNKAQEIHVLLVDPNKQTLDSTTAILEFFSYQVTVVPSGSAALLILSDHCKKFDLLLVDIQLPDLNGFILLHAAVQREVTTILMLADEDPILTRLALENGALFVLRKPVSASVLKNLWQHVDVVTKDVSKSITARNRDSSIETVNNDGNSSDDTTEIVSEEIISKGEGSSSMMKKSRDSKKKASKVRMNKATTVWTEELHGVFADAVKQLGHGRCYPKEILQLMNVPGLTRMQIASHLQKCRDGHWFGTYISNSVSRTASRRLGAMPLLGKTTPAPQTPSPQSQSCYFNPQMHLKIGQAQTTTRTSSPFVNNYVSTSSSGGTFASNQLLNKLAKVGESKPVVDRLSSRFKPVFLIPRKGKDEDSEKGSKKN